MHIQASVISTELDGVYFIAAELPDESPPLRFLIGTADGEALRLLPGDVITADVALDAVEPCLDGGHVLIGIADKVELCPSICISQRE